jgi:hypothetical protein
MGKVMIEDKLEHDERLRLECVAQTIQNSAGSQPSVEHIINMAKELEKYIKGVELS